MEKNEGKVFEKDFQDSYPIGVFIYRLKDTASTFTGGKNTKYTTYNMCDYIAFNPEHKCVLALELKSFKGKSMPFTNIKSHQLTDMKKAKDEQNIESYFVLNFRDVGETYLVDIDDMIWYIEHSGRKSIDLLYCRENAIFLPQELKRVHYKYNMEEIFDLL